MGSKSTLKSEPPRSTVVPGGGHGRDHAGAVGDVVPRVAVAELAVVGVGHDEVPGLDRGDRGGRVVRGVAVVIRRPW